VTWGKCDYLKWQLDRIWKVTAVEYFKIFMWRGPWETLTVGQAAAESHTVFEADIFFLKRNRIRNNIINIYRPAYLQRTRCVQ